MRPHAHTHTQLTLGFAPSVDALKRRLQEEGWPSAYIAGGLAQQERSAAIAALRDFKIRVLISTDLVRATSLYAHLLRTQTARGIDVDRVNLVVNLDMPHDPETYLHRIGRTGRFGAPQAIDYPLM